MQNKDIRQAITDAGLKYWQVAEALNVADSTFTKWLRKELDPEKKAAVMDAIEKLKEGLHAEDKSSKIDC